jgi:uncharacterized membrane protein YeaQ/YmgE (transglycosylase-associated protein family)
MTIGMNVISWIVVGLIAGFLAGKVMRGGYGLIGDIVVGVLGGLLGGYLATNLLHINQTMRDQHCVDPGRLVWGDLAARRTAPVGRW